MLLAHQPVMVAAAVRGVDLQISGRTHGGQMWPFHNVVAAVQPTLAGLFVVGDTQLYVSRGAGFWGPPVRIGDCVDEGSSPSFPNRPIRSGTANAAAPRGGRPPAFDAEVYKGRNVVERGFNVTKQWRGLATRYDKLAIVHRDAAVLRAITLWLPHLSDTAQWICESRNA